MTNHLVYFRFFLINDFVLFLAKIHLKMYDDHHHSILSRNFIIIESFSSFLSERIVKQKIQHGFCSGHHDDDSKNITNIHSPRKTIFEMEFLFFYLGYFCFISGYLGFANASFFCWGPTIMTKTFFLFVSDFRINKIEDKWREKTK